MTVSEALRLVANTTLRLAIPTIGGTILGVWLDNVLGSAPLATIVCLTFGVGLAILLVWLQIRKERSS